MPKAQNELANKLCQNDKLSMTQSLIWVYYQPVLKNTKTTLFMFMIQFQAQKNRVIITSFQRYVSFVRSALTHQQQS